MNYVSALNSNQLYMSRESFPTVIAIVCQILYTSESRHQNFYLYKNGKDAADDY